MARFFLHSAHGDVAFLGRRLIDEGHEVNLYVRDPMGKDLGKGLVPLTASPVVPRDAVVIFDNPGLGNLGQALRRQGHPVIGGNLLDSELEFDRAKGTRAMERVGIAVPETKAFTSLAQARAYLATHRGHFFFKASGNLSTSLTQDGDSDDLARFLTWAEKHVQGVRALELQRQVAGTEVSVEGWFDGQRWVGPFNATLEDKKFLTGNIGPRTGCQANVVWAWSDPVPRLAQLTLVRMTPGLRANQYVGPLDLNMILDEDGIPHGLEWSARTGFDALQAWSMLLEGDMGEQLAAFAKGELRNFSVRQDEIALTLRLSVPPYPSDAPQVAKKMKGLPLDPKLLDDPTRTFLDDVMVGEDGLPELSGRDGAIGVIGAAGRDIGTLREQLVKRAKGFDIPQLQHRLDPVSRAETAWAALRSFGYLSSRDVPGQRRVSSALPPSSSSTARDDAANSPPEDEATHAPAVAERGEFL